MSERKRVEWARSVETTRNFGIKFLVGIPEAYNARVSIRVVGGGGSVSAYASVVDNETQDPTYVPAQ